jgi:hypothetical protein
MDGAVQSLLGSEDGVALFEEEQCDGSVRAALHHQDQQFLGRQQIYSHHIISKQKRSNTNELAKDLTLTGCLKVG